MSRLPRFRLVFEEDASEFVIALPRRKSRRLLDICYVIAQAPYETPDFIFPDADGRPVSYFSTQGYLIGYWVDSAAKRVVIAEIELAD